ncbi:MAG: GFA family protein, partial [Pseudomonadota bacterium]
YHGACLCGSVQIRVTAPPLMTMACHCRDCQKMSAGAYTLTTMFPKDSVSFSGDFVIGGLRSSERTHYFCASCLNIVYSQMRQAPERVNLRTSLLQDAAAFLPFIEIRTDERLPWASTSAPHSFARQPASLAELQVLMTEYAQSFGRP